MIIEAGASIVQPPMEHGKMNLPAIVNTSCCISSMLGVTVVKEMINSDFSLYVLEQTKIVHVDDRFLSKIIMILRNQVEGKYLNLKLMQMGIMILQNHLLIQKP